MQGIADDPKTFWSSGKKSASSPFMAMIWFEFDTNNHPTNKNNNIVIPSSISFMPHQAASGYSFESARQWMPSKWQFVGSNDDKCDPHYGDWRVLCEDLSGQMIKSREESRDCEVGWGVAGAAGGAAGGATVGTTGAKICGPRAFRCLGLRVLETEDGNYAALHKMTIWMREYIS